MTNSDITKKSSDPKFSYTQVPRTSCKAQNHKPMFQITTSLCCTLQRRLQQLCGWPCIVLLIWPRFYNCKRFDFRLTGRMNFTVYFFYSKTRKCNFRKRWKWKWECLCYNFLIKIHEGFILQQLVWLGLQGKSLSMNDRPVMAFNLNLTGKLDTTMV